MICILGDTHFPHADYDALNAALQFIRKHKPATVVQIGDLYEMANFARWDPSHEIATPSHEIEKGLEQATAMWAAVRRYVPQARCVQLLGNHDVWPLKRMFERMPAAESLMRAGLERLFAFEGVERAASDRDVIDLGKVGKARWYAAHGWSKPGAHATKLARNVVVGHLHRGYVQTVPGGYTELNAGWLGDWESKTKWYTPARVNNWQTGIGVIDEHGPRFIPFGTEAGK